MAQIPVIPDNAPFSADQRLWLNGFLAGYFARMLVPGPGLAPSAPATPSVPLLLLFGSQTGTAEGLAKRLSKEAEKLGFAPQVLPLNDYEKSGLVEANHAVIISSTWGDGDPPDNAANFWSWLNSDK